jgi:hypothetical protein
VGAFACRLLCVSTKPCIVYSVASTVTFADSTMEGAVRAVTQHSQLHLPFTSSNRCIRGMLFTHACAHTCTFADIQTHTCVHMCTCTHTHTHTHTHKHTHTHTHCRQQGSSSFHSLHKSATPQVQLCVFVCACVRMCMCVFVCVCCE